MQRLSAFFRNVASTLRGIQFDRRRRRLAARYLRGSGLEIGALHKPLPVPSNANVRYVDRMTLPELREHYPDLSTAALVHVDVVDDGETLESQRDGSADFIIANHFMEHTEDPLRALASHLRVLRPEGILYLAVPDRRRTFDAAREPTSLDHVIRDHLEGPARSRRKHQEEWALLVEGVPPQQMTAKVGVLEDMDYSIHFHCWSPSEFTEFLEYAKSTDSFTILDLQPNGHEFIAIIRRDQPGAEQSRFTMPRARTRAHPRR